MDNSENKINKDSEIQTRKKEIRRKLLFYPLSALVALLGFIGLFNPGVSDFSNYGIFLIVLGLGYLVLDGIILSQNAKKKKQDNE